MPDALAIGRAIDDVRPLLYREQAQTILQEANKCRGNDGKLALRMVQLGWWAGGGKDIPPLCSMNLARRDGQSTTDWLHEMYVMGHDYAVLLEQLTRPQPPLKKSERNFGVTLRRTATRLWRGQATRGEFIEAFWFGVERGLWRAALEGAGSLGFAEDELSQIEIAKLTTLIDNNRAFIPGLADWIEQNSQANGGKFVTVTSRITRDWVNRYQQIFQQAQALVGRDLKATWTLGVAEHCTSCIKLDKKTRRWSWWNEQGILPRVPGAEYLKCGGYR